MVFNLRSKAVWITASILALPIFAFVAGAIWAISLCRSNGDVEDRWERHVAAHMSSMESRPERARAAEPVIRSYSVDGGQEAADYRGVRYQPCGFVREHPSGELHRLTPALYSKCSSGFSGGLGRVHLPDGSLGYVDETGRLAIHLVDSAGLNFLDSRDFFESRARVKVEIRRSSGERVIRYGFIDETGNFAVEPIYQDANPAFIDGLARVSNDNWLGGMVFGSAMVRHFPEDLACVLGTVRIIDAEGNEIH